MPTTTVTIANPTSTNGTVTVKQGELSGRPGRTVILEATPATGYVFDKWEIETTAIQLSEYTRVGARYASLDEVCSATQVDLTTPLYSDGSQLYSDSQGQYAASVGYYQSNRGTYYNYTGMGIPPLQTCPQPVTIQPQSGGSGGTNTTVNQFGQVEGVGRVPDNAFF